ncbi:MAG TPA: hypothetical protein VF244_11080 [Acidimicrobiales bacterium]
MGTGTRAFVAVFLTAFVACGLLQVEAWPLSGFQLFSRLRTDQVESWQVTAVTADGAETPIQSAHKGRLHVLKGFGDLAPDGRQAVCRVWASELDSDVVEIKIFATTGSDRRLRYVCPGL